MKKIIYSVIAASMFAFGLTSCSPVDSDSHSLGGEPVNTSALAISANVTTDETGQANVVTVTNNSQAQNGVRYYISLDGKSLIETVAGGSVNQLVKKKGTYTAQLLAFSACDQQTVSTSFSITADWIDPDAPVEPEGWMGFTAGTNIIADWNPNYSFWFADNNWSQIADPVHSGDLQTGFNLVMNDAGGSQWMAQLHVQDNGPTLSANKLYDFSIVINSSADNVKATVKPQMQGDDNTFFTDAQFALHQGNNVIALSGVQGFDGVFKIAFDFAGAPAGTEFVISHAFLSEHNDANVIPYDYDDSKNLLKGQSFGADFRFWFADNNWSQIADPEHDGDTSEFTLTIPDAMGGSQWMGQVHIPFDKINLSAGKRYNFSVVILTDKDAPGITVKPQNDGNDSEFLDEARHAIVANVPTAIVYKGRNGFDGKFRLCLDFGGTPAGTKVKVISMFLAEE